MKKKYIILIVIGVLLLFVLLPVGIVLTLYFFYSSRTSLDTINRPRKVERVEEFIKVESKPLIEYSYSNYAWGYFYYGEVILENGDRYTFYCEESRSSLTDCLTSKVGSINKSDVEKIKELGKKVNDKKITSSNVANDFGEYVIYYYDGEDDFILAGKGDNEIKNASAGSLLNHLKKYGIYL